MTNRGSQLNIRMDGELKEAFIKKAKENGTTVTDLIVAYAKEYLGIVETQKSNNEISDLRQRLIQLEQMVMGESAA